MKTVTIVAILNALGIIAIPILIGLGVIRPRSRTEYMKRRILRKLNENANQHKFFIPVGKLGDILIQRTNPIFRMRFCEIFLESIRELDEKEIMITDRFKLSKSPRKYLPGYHSKYFTYGSLHKIDPNIHIGLNNTESREYIKSCELSQEAQYSPKGSV